MQSRANSLFAQTTVEVNPNKEIPGSGYTNVYRSTVGSDVFAVLQQERGSTKDVHMHEFKKLVSQTSFIGVYHRENSLSWVHQEGAFHEFTHYSDLLSGRDWDNLYNSAIADMYEQIRSNGVGTGLNLAVSLLEARQVKSMIRNAAKLSNFVRRFKPSEWKNNWLEYTYGWKPLVNDIYGTFDAIMHRRLETFNRFTGKSSDKWSYGRTYTDELFSGTRMPVWENSSYRYLVSCDFRVESGVRNLLAGYTSTNPAVIAWELVPYSFVVDWLYDIGGYLQNMENALRYSQGFVRGFYVQTAKSDVSAQIFGTDPGISSGLSQYCYGEAFVKQRYKLRGRIGAYPFPVLPKFQTDLGWRRLVSAASLLGQHLGRGR